jgi:hypothetical protein
LGLGQGQGRCTVGHPLSVASAAAPRPRQFSRWTRPAPNPRAPTAWQSY